MLRSSLGALALAAAFASSAVGQGATVQGTIVRIAGADTVPAAAVWAVLHRVTPTGGAAVDSIRTDGAGRYALDAGDPDSTATYLISARYAGIAYFSEPRVGVGPRDTLATLVVFDTSSVAPSIRIAERHIVLRPRGPQGAMRVLELVVLENAGTITRFAPDTTRPVWEGQIPAGVLEFEVGAADLTAAAVFLRGDRMAVSAPMPPGRRQLLVSYVVPGGVRDVVFPATQASDVLNLLVGDSAVTVVAPELAGGGVEMLEGIPYRRYSRVAAPAGVELRVEFPSERAMSALLLPILVPVMVLVMIAAWLRWRRLHPRPIVVAPTAAALAAEIAALDREFAGRENDAYRRRRADLKTQLQAALARPEPPA